MYIQKVVPLPWRCSMVEKKKKRLRVRCKTSHLQFQDKNMFVPERASNQPKSFPLVDGRLSPSFYWPSPVLSRYIGSPSLVTAATIGVVPCCTWLHFTFNLSSILQCYSFGHYCCEHTFAGVHINQDLIWCVKLGVYKFFWGPSWVLNTMPPRNTEKFFCI